LFHDIGLVEGHRCAHQRCDLSGPSAPSSSGRDEHQEGMIDALSAGGPTTSRPAPSREV
jgi:hypothetical protein